MCLNSKWSSTKLVNFLSCTCQLQLQSILICLFIAGITISIALWLLFFPFYFLGISYTLSKSGRPAIFTRDPDANALEFTQVDGWWLASLSHKVCIYIVANGKCTATSLWCTVAIYFHMNGCCKQCIVKKYPEVCFGWIIKLIKTLDISNFWIHIALKNALLLITFHLDFKDILCASK